MIPDALTPITDSDMETHEPNQMAKERFQKYFKLSNYVIFTLHKWINVGSMPEPQSPAELVLHASNIRAFNLYRSINILLETDHWEDAAILARSMFELLLNLEEIYREENRVEQRSRVFLRFDYLQRYLHIKADFDYKDKTGRSTEEENKKLADLDKCAEICFAEFKRSKGRKGWKTYWCGKKVYQLAKESKSAIRLPQYNLCYSLSSDLSHSSPFSVMCQMIFGDREVSLKEEFRRHEEQEEKYLQHVLIMSTSWLLEILYFGKDMIPDYQLEWNFSVLQKVYGFLGVTPPPLPWE